MTGIASADLGARLPEIAAGIREQRIRTLLVVGEDVTRHGIDAELLGQLDFLAVSDILPGATSAAAHLLLPGCAPAEKRGSFINVKGRVQRFLKAVEPPGAARPELDFLAELAGKLTGSEMPTSVEGLFNQMTAEVAGLQGLRWAALGDGGATLPA